jgi:hypothetical protein
MSGMTGAAQRPNEWLNTLLTCVSSLVAAVHQQALQLGTVAGQQARVGQQEGAQLAGEEEHHTWG